MTHENQWRESFPNSLGQVVSAQHVNTSGSSRHYTFNSIGDRNQHREGGHTSSTGTPTNYTPTALNQYSAVGSVSPIYDTDGNMTSGPIPNAPTALAAFTWDGENRLLSVTPNGGSTTTFLHDAMGRRVAKTTGTTRTYFLYDGWNIVAEYTGSVHTTGTPPALTLERTNVWGTDLSGSQQGAGGVGGLLATYLHNAGANSGFYYPTYDGNGNVSEYLNGTGVVQAHFEYDPFGNTLVNTDTLNRFPIRFSTKYRDQETGLYYYGYRYYDPGLGRWPSRDPIEEEGGENLYSFVGNGPLNHVDLLGLIDITASGVDLFTGQSNEDYVGDAFETIMRRRPSHGKRSIASLIDSVLTLSIINRVDAALVNGPWIADKLREGSDKGQGVHRILSHSQGFTNAVSGVERFAKEFKSSIKKRTTIYIVGAAPKVAASQVDAQLKRATDQAGGCLKIKLLIIFSPRDWGIPQVGGLAWPGTWDRGGVRSVPVTEIMVPVRLRHWLGHDSSAHFGTLRRSSRAYGGTIQDTIRIGTLLRSDIRAFFGGQDIPSKAHTIQAR